MRYEEKSTWSFEKRMTCPLSIKIKERGMRREFSSTSWMMCYENMTLGAIPTILWPLGIKLNMKTRAQDGTVEGRKEGTGFWWHCQASEPTLGLPTSHSLRKQGRALFFKPLLVRWVFYYLQLQASLLISPHLQNCWVRKEVWLWSMI